MSFVSIVVLVSEVLLKCVEIQILKQWVKINPRRRSGVANSIIGGGTYSYIRVHRP